jgi:hypothetical protein
MKLKESREKGSFLYSVVSALFCCSQSLIKIVFGQGIIEEDNGRLAQLV